MKNMRIPLLIAWGVAVLGIVLGSFFDFQISSAIASPTNEFALAVSAIGPTLGFCGVAFLGGGFFAFALKGDYHIGLKVLFYILAAVCLGVSIYYAGPEYFGVNGFKEVDPDWIGYLIAAVPLVGAEVGGYFVFKNNQNKNMWIVMLIGLGVLLIALAGMVSVLKDIMHRPRFRTVSVTEVPFHDWWKPCKDYETYMTNFDLAKEEFKSYPSGHTTEASIAFVPSVFLPLANEKFKKYQLPAFIASCALVLLVAFARILAAAHYLSDVSTGATITLTLTIIANEVVMRVKALHIENQQPVEG